MRYALYEGIPHASIFSVQFLKNNKNQGAKYPRAAGAAMAPNFFQIGSFLQLSKMHGIMQGCAIATKGLLRQL